MHVRSKLLLMQQEELPVYANRKKIKCILDFEGKMMFYWAYDQFEYSCGRKDSLIKWHNMHRVKKKAFLRATEKDALVVKEDKVKDEQEVARHILC